MLPVQFPGTERRGSSHSTTDTCLLSKFGCTTSQCSCLRLHILLQSQDFPIQRLGLTFVAQLSHARISGSAHQNNRQRTYLQKMRSGPALINDREAKGLSRRLLAFTIADLHFLEHGLVQQDPEGLVCPHDESCFLLLAGFGNVELECSFPLFVPATAVEVV